MRAKLYIAAFTLLLWPAQASAEFRDKTPVDVGGGPASDAPASSGSAMLRTLVGLIIVLAVIYGFHRLLKRLGRGQTGGGTSPAVELVSRTALDKDVAVYLVRSGDRVSVLSMASGRSELLRELTLEQAEAEGLMHTNPSAMPTSVREAAGELRSLADRVRGRRQGRSDMTVQELLEREARS